MTTTEERANDASLYPARDEVFYGRGVWAMGEDGDAGEMVQGHDRRALAALIVYARFMGSVRDLHGDLLRASASASPRIRARWAVWRDECGCTEAEHRKHEKLAQLRDIDVYDVHEDFKRNRYCSELPPCTPDRFGWMCTWHDDPATRPDAAVPVLVWDGAS